MCQTMDRIGVATRQEEEPCWSADGSRWLLMVGSKSASITFAAGQRSEIGRQEVLREQSLSGFEIGMTMDDFQIDRIRQDVTESLKSAVRYSIPLDPRCFRWKMLSLSGPKARVLLQILIPLVTWSVVNVTAEVKDFRLISLDPGRLFCMDETGPSAARW